MGGNKMVDTVAVVSGGSPDYLIDIVADGMVRLLGRENVYIKYYWLKPGIWEDRRYKHLYNLTAKQPNKISLGECQALVTSVRFPVEHIRKYKTEVGGVVAVVDGEDVGDLKSRHLKIADVYFKREYFRDLKYPVKTLNLPWGRQLIPTCYRRYPEKVVNLSFGVVPLDYEIQNLNLDMKTGNAFFAGGLSNDIRKQLKDMIVKSGFTYLPNILDMNTYIEEVRRHWICIAPRGSGWDTYRYWEIPYIGSVLLCQNHPLKIDDDFVHGRSCLRFSTVEEARLIINQSLNDKEKLCSILKSGHELVMKKHLSIHRAMKVLDIIRLLSKK
jgi:hypothetical protein